MSEWINLEERHPNEWDEVLVKTDCPDCPILQAIFFEGEFRFQTIMQCDKHYETDEKFMCLKVSLEEELQLFRDRIIQWLLVKRD